LQTQPVPPAPGVAGDEALNQDPALARRQVGVAAEPNAAALGLDTALRVPVALGQLDEFDALEVQALGSGRAQAQDLDLAVVELAHDLGPLPVAQAADKALGPEAPGPGAGDHGLDARAQEVRVHQAPEPGIGLGPPLLFPEHGLE